MCLLVICSQVVPGAAVLVAANREERFDRKSLAPEIREGRPRVMCGLDEEAGGTWLGVNEHGLVVAVTNRRKTNPPEQPRSRGLLCRELLVVRNADEAARYALDELSAGRYDGANYVCVDEQGAAVVYGGDEVRTIELEPGIHLMTNGDLNDPADARLTLARSLFSSKTIGTVDDFLALGREVCAHPEVIIRTPQRGTVSSDLIALTDSPGDAVYLHAPGPPDQQLYVDWSALLREVLGMEESGSQGVTK